jgi:hypothetical protein
LCLISKGEVISVTPKLIGELLPPRLASSKKGDNGTYIGEINFSLDILVHLIYLFALGVPAYRIRFYVPLSLTTIEKTFRGPCLVSKLNTLYPL